MKHNKVNPASASKKQGNPNIKVIKTQYPEWLTWLLACIAFAAFANTLMHQFALDDRAVTFQNKYVMKGFAGIPDILKTFYWAGYWDNNAGLFRPLSLIMFAIEWQISPNNPPLHHLINVVIYSLSIALLFKLIKLILPELSHWFAFSVVLLFALHPLHTEVVANIKSRDELLCFLFFVITAIFLIRKPTYNLNDTVLAGISFFLCLISKEGGILYAPVFALMLYLLRKNSIPDLAKKLAPSAVASVIWLIWHQSVIRSSPFERITYSYWDNSLVGCGSIAERVATGISILGRYLVKSVWPYEMSYDYSYAQVPCETFMSANVLATLLVTFILLSVAAIYLKRLPVVSFGILFFFITSVLFINVFTLIGATMADRFLFAPVLGIILMLVWLLFRQLNVLFSEDFKNAATYIVLVIAILYGYKTINRNADWFNDNTIFNADVKVSDRSARTHYNYATVLFSNLPQDENAKFARLDSAIAEFNKGISIDSNDYNSYTNLGVAYYRRKMYAESIRATRQAFQMRNDSDLLTNLGDAFYMNKDYDSSIYYHTTAIRTRRDQKDTYNLLGSAFFARNQFPLAVQVFADGVKKDSTYGALWLNYGNALGVMKDYSGAIAAFENAYKYDNTLKNAIYFIAITYTNMGNKEKADEYMQKFNSIK